MERRWWWAVAPAGLGIVIVLVMMSLFLMVEQIGDQLKDPFENRSNDTPMTSICRTIEINLDETEAILAAASLSRTPSESMPLDSG